MNRIISTMVVVVIAFFSLPSMALAYTSSNSALFSLTVPDTVLHVKGFASPGALVSISDAGSVIGTTVANSAGAFDTNFTAQTPGLHDISVSYKDVSGISSSVFQTNVNLVFRTETVIDVFLSPTIIRAGDYSVTSGSLVQIRGSSIPNSSIKLVIDGGLKTFTTTTNSSGNYEFLLDSSSFYSGIYNAQVTATKSPNTSQQSLVVNFKIVPDLDGNDIIVVGSDSLSPPVPTAPEDNSVIDGDTVTINGESEPNAEIIIFENGVRIGSVFAGPDGKWSFEYHANSTPVALTFEACRGGVCSLISKTLTLNFPHLISACDIKFHLEKYRFWDVAVGQTINLDVEQVSDDGVIEIDWGDSINERFDIKAGGGDSFQKRFNQKGRYAGSLIYRLGHDEQNKCYIQRYFSVNVNKDASRNGWLWWLLLLLPIFWALYKYLKRRSRKLDQSVK